MPLAITRPPSYAEVGRSQGTEARKKADVTQTDLAERWGRPQSFVAEYDGRERRLDVAEYLQITRELGADPYRLLKAADKATR